MQELNSVPVTQIVVAAVQYHNQVGMFRSIYNQEGSRMAECKHHEDCEHDQHDDAL